MAQAKFDASRDPAAAPAQGGRPACTWCSARPAASDSPWCHPCKDRHRTMSVADYNAMIQAGYGRVRALPRQPGLRIHGAKQIAEAMRPAAATVREWADQMGIDTGDDALAADRQWRAEHGAPTLPAGTMPDGRPEPPASQDGVSDGAQDAMP